MRRVLLIPFVLVLASLLPIAAPALAGTIVQTSGFQIAPADTRPARFSLLAPALAPLNAVVGTGSANGSSGSYTLTNMTDNPVSFTVTTRDDLVILPALNLHLAATFTETLAAHQSMGFGYGIGSGPTTDANLLTTGLSGYVGTGTFEPFYTDSEVVLTDNPAIRVDSVARVPFWFGSVTLTYYYGSTFAPAPTPEPASLVLFGLGVAGVGIVRRGVRSPRPVG